MYFLFYHHFRHYSYDYAYYCRDLKPENILLDDYRNPVVIDFGLAIKINPAQMLRTLCGTDGFIAPEMRAGKPFHPKPCDVFSLGMV